MESKKILIKEYVKDVIKKFPIKEYGFNKLSVDYLTSELFSFSMETIPDTKVLRTYVGGDTVEQYKFLLVSNMLYTNDVRIMIDNSGVFEVFSNWLESLELEKPENADFTPIKFNTLGHVFINDNDTEKARYTQEIQFIYSKRKYI